MLGGMTIFVEQKFGAVMFTAVIDPAADEYQLPYPLLFNETSASCMPAPEMDYPCDIKMWNQGHMDVSNISIEGLTDTK